MDYRSLVLDLLKEKKYPKLQDHVVMDVYYKMIPMDCPSITVSGYDRRFDNPEDVYVRNSNPFTINFMVCVGNHTFYLHEVDTLDTKPLSTYCTTIRLNQSYLDSHIFRLNSDSFEEEIYKFITFLNFDVSKIASVLNMGFFASTRFLPQRINLWPFKHTTRDIGYEPLSQTRKSCFGPPSQDEVIPIRMISGRLSECKSRSTLLSLNNDIEFPELKYTQHFSTRWNTLVPLAYNPLENPIIS